MRTLAWGRYRDNMMVAWQEFVSLYGATKDEAPQRQAMLEQVHKRAMRENAKWPEDRFGAGLSALMGAICARLAGDREAAMERVGRAQLLLGDAPDSLELVVEECRLLGGGSA